jgi:Ca2+-binding RTX toxin-like protein
VRRDWNEQMPIATELAIDTTADATTLAQTIFGSGTVVTSATLTGATGASATYSGADVTLGGIAPGDSGIILSTGLAENFTNSSGTTNTNTAENGASSSNFVAGDSSLGSQTGQTTSDAVVLEATFTPTGDFITMLFVFSSEEYLEYVNSGVNDAFGVWVNNVYVPFTPAPNELVSIDTINDSVASNLYLDNPVNADTYNTEMDGITQVLSIKAPVNTGQPNTIRIALADGGDSVWDTNVLIGADSVKTIALAFDDEVTLQQNKAISVDVLTNDVDNTGGGLTITQLNGVDIVVGQTVTLPTGEQLTLNADGTLTILADNDIGSEAFTYTVVDTAGNTDVGFVRINIEAAIPLDYIVEGTGSADNIDALYTLDPEGDVVDGSDALDGSEDDLIEAYGGNDTVTAGDGDDTVDAGTGNDSVFAGTGNDRVIAGDGDDTLLGGLGNDSLDGDVGNDSIDGGAGADTIIGDAGNDTLLGGAGNDEIYVSTGNNQIEGGDGNDLVFAGDQADTIEGDAGSDTISGGSGADLIDGGDDNDRLSGDDGNDTVLGGAGNDSVFGGAGDDSLSGGTGNDSMEAWVGNDTLDGGDGDDYMDGADGNDSLLGGAGNDTLLGGNGGGQDTLEGGAGNDLLSAGDADDTLSGGTGDDTQFGANGDDLFILENGFGNDVIGGGETVETNGDTLDLGAVTADLTLDLTANNPEAGTVTDGTDTATFTEIENIVLGAGTDTLVLADGSGADSVQGFSAPTNDGSGNWTGIDLLDVTGLTDANGAQVNTADVTVDDTNGDGTGDAILTFPNGESLTLTGVPATTFSDPAALEAIGIPAPNYIVDGTGGNDVIDATYTGDPQGDMVDDNDNATGTNADSILAGAGDDTVVAGTGADTVQGDAGNDNIDGGAGNDLLYGGDDADTISGGTGSDFVSGGDGADSLAGDDGSDNISGGAGNDTVEGGADNDNITGGTGNDALYGGAGDDDVDGGTDNDTLDLGDWSFYRNLTETADPDANSTSGSVEVQDAAGNWITVTFAEIETLVLPPPLPNYIVEGTSGDDVINAGYTGDPEGDMIDANDALDGSDDDSVEAGAGNDSITSSDGDDTVMAGTGNDRVLAGAGDDQVFGEAGNDVLFGFDGNDTLSGGDGVDVINGMTGDDLMDGGADNDSFVLEGGFGTDTIVGGEGVTTGIDTDTIRTNAASLTDAVNLVYSVDEAGTLTAGTNSAEFSEIEYFRLGDTNDTVDGTATTTGISVDTGGGNDIITGGNDVDSIAAGAGDDTFTLVDLGEAGTDTIFVNGGEGGETNGDTLDLNGQADRTTINITNPIDVGGGISGTVEMLDGTVVNFTNIENIICFVPGTMIATQAGLRPIEDLRVGDPVMTQDNGMQRIGWIGKTTVAGRDSFAPVRFAPNTFAGADTALTVSPQHRMLFKGYRAELLFGQSEVLVPAVHLIDGTGVTRAPCDSVTYIHITFSQHEIIFANGIPTESYHPNAYGVGGLADETREELFALFPDLRSNLGGYGDTDRMALKAREAKLMADYL